MNSEEIKFLMNVFDKIQDIKDSNPADPNLPEIERLFTKHASDSLSFQKVRLTDIHEHSIENVISKQADNFYNSIPFFQNIPASVQAVSDIDLPNIIAKLNSDYKQMEHQRRRDNFERFAQCIYQQFEAIVSLLYSTGNLWNYILQKRTEKTFSYRQIDNTGIHLVPYRSGLSVQSKILGYRHSNFSYFTDNDYNQLFQGTILHSDRRNDFQVKLRTILFVLYFEEKVLQENFDSMFENMYEIVLVRNTFHRGADQFTARQKVILDRVNNDKSKYYHKFFGILNDFISKSLSSSNIGIV